MDATPVKTPKTTVVGVQTKIVLYPIGTVDESGKFVPVVDNGVITCLPIRNTPSRYQEFKIAEKLFEKAVLRQDKNGLTFTRVELAGYGKISDLENERGEKIGVCEVRSLRDATPANAAVKTASQTVGAAGIVLPEF